jgi:hypothetical protein
MAETKEGETRFGDNKPGGQGTLTVMCSAETDPQQAGKGSVIKMYAKASGTGRRIPFWLYVTEDGFLRVTAVEPTNTNL